MRILQSGRKKWLTIKTKITKTEKIKGNQAAVKDKAAVDRADNPVHKVDRVVLVPEEEAVPEVPVLEVADQVVQVDNPVQAEDKAGRADNPVQVDRVVRAAAAPAVRVVHKAAGNPARKAVRAAEVALAVPVAVNLVRVAEAARAVVAALVVRAAPEEVAAPVEAAAARAEVARGAAVAPAVRAAQAVEAAPEEVAVLEAAAAPVAAAALEVVDQVVLEAAAAAREAALVQVEAAAVPVAAGKTDKLFFNINKSDSRRIAFVLLKDLKMLAKLKKINLKVAF